MPPTVPPTVPRPGAPPYEPPGEPPDQPRSGGEDAETTQVFPVPGATPAYPGWESDPPEEEPEARPPAPSRYEGGGHPSFTPPGGSGPAGPEHPYGGGGPAQPLPDDRPAQPPQEEAVPGTTPSYPYGGPPGYTLPPYAYPGAPQQYGGRPAPDRTGDGLATAALVLGVASPFLVFVCFTGLITAILSIVFGCVALARRAGRGRAIAGIVISVLSLVLFAIVASWFWRNVVQECAHLPSPEADRCVQDHLSWTRGGSLR
ncbi:hypothetical protein [Nonomuraea sp. NPDC050783]|uniref:hypothetical protein n=1 Tax=Nonomuraea sp. NPDC050783 TaxID=3154634 RepID=UPI003467E791